MGNPQAGYKGGINGWNEKNKGEMASLLETAPTTGANMEEINCAGRMLLVAGMMLNSNILSSNNLQVATSRRHTFMGYLDELGVGRRLEISGYRNHSGYGGLQDSLEDSTVGRKKTKIGWTDWKKGVSLAILRQFSNMLDTANSKIVEDKIKKIYSDLDKRLEGN